VAELDLFLGPPIGLHCSAATLQYTPNGSAVLILGLTNRRPNPGDLLRKVEVYLNEPVTHRLRKNSVRITNGGPDPKRMHPVQVQWDAPAKGGTLQLEGRIRCEFIDDRVAWLGFDIAVEPRSAITAGPQAMHVHLDAHNAALVENIQIAAPNTGGRPAAGPADFQPVQNLQFLREEVAQQWINHQAHRTHAGDIVLHGPALSGQPRPCRGLLLQITRGQPANTLEELWLLAGPSLTLGRDITRADLLLALEPWTQAAHHASSMRISSRHLRLRLDPHGGAVEDLGSMNGTHLDGRPLAPNSPAPLRAPAEIEVARVLKLRAEPLFRPSGLAYALRLRRLDNLTHRAYLIAPEGLALDPQHADPIGPPPNPGAPAAPVHIYWHEGSPAIAHNAPTELRLDGRIVQPGRAAYLAPGQVYTAGALRLEITDEHLPLRA